MSALPDGLGAASARRFLRGNLPAVYSESLHGRPPPVMGLLEGLERVLDPVVILLDNLSSHLKPATAPAEMLDFLTELTGAPLDDTLPVEARRALAVDAAPIARSRGTKAGLQLALIDALPDLRPAVIDNGRASWEPRPRAPAPAPAPPPETAWAPVAPTSAPQGAPAARSFEVLLAREPDGRQGAQLALCIADHLPVGVTYRLRVAGD